MADADGSLWGRFVLCYRTAHGSVIEREPHVPAFIVHGFRTRNTNFCEDGLPAALGTIPDAQRSVQHHHSACLYLWEY